MTWVKTLKHPGHLYWWQWGQIAGLLLPIGLLSLGLTHSLLWALAAHFLVDFTAQSTQTALGKARRDRNIVVYHAFIAGGYAGFIAGGLPGLTISVAAHFMIDMTNKFGLDEPTGPALDQTAHLLTLLAIWYLI